MEGRQWKEAPGRRNRREARRNLLVLAALLLVVSPVIDEPAHGHLGESAETDDIYVMSADEQTATPLVEDPADDQDPAWSAAGLLAFSSNRQGNYDIYVTDGSITVRLTADSADDRTPTWSPDGSAIAFTSFRDGHPEIYVMNTDGSGQVRLTSGPESAETPSWSPDGDLIAFVSGGRGSSPAQVAVVSPDGSGRTVVTLGSDPAWSPDGSLIAYNHGSRIFVVHPDGSGARAVTSAVGNTRPAWSPDGARIVFMHTDDGVDADLWVVNPDGSGEGRLATGLPGDESGPGWAPGSPLAFAYHSS